MTSRAGVLQRPWQEKEIDRRDSDLNERKGGRAASIDGPGRIEWS